MEQKTVVQAAGVLKVLVTVVFAVNLLVLPLVPGLVFAKAEVRWTMLRSLFGGSGLKYFALAWAGVWADPYAAMLTLFLLACGVCTAVILWQGRRVLDTILNEAPFCGANAGNLRRAAACCFLISAFALVRVVWGTWFFGSLRPLLTYCGLFVPVFLMAGLLCLVMSALFRQAAELKAENDLTI